VPQTSRIPTPLKQHLLRFRLGILPALAFGTCLLLTLWLWNRQSNRGTVLGEVEAFQVDVTAGVEGQLVAPESDYWQIFDRVAKGQILARLDDRDIQAQVAVLQAEIQTLQNELGAAQAEFEMDRANLGQGQQRQMADLMWQIEQRDLDAKRIRAEAQGIKAEMDALDARIAELERTRQSGMATTTALGALNELRLQRQALKGQLDAQAQLYQETKAQQQKLTDEQKQLPPLELPEVERLLDPIRAEMAVQEAMIQQLEVQRENLIVVAPFDGVITAIHRWPGQRTVPGDPIVTLASPDSGYVIGYLRENQQIELYKGMKVALRVGGQPDSEEYISAVETIGPQVAPLPFHRLADQNVIERATPFKIPIPPGLQQKQLRPGQLVHVIFERPRSAAP
jgi:multidrug resistance efflux pump